MSAHSERRHDVRVICASTYLICFIQPEVASIFWYLIGVLFPEQSCIGFPCLEKLKNIGGKRAYSSPYVHADVFFLDADSFDCRLL